MPWDLLQNSPLFYVASSPGSPLPHLLDGHRKLVGCSAIPARSCPGPVRYHWTSIVELEVPPDETPGLMTLHPHNTNVLQSITYAKSEVTKKNKSWKRRRRLRMAVAGITPTANFSTKVGKLQSAGCRLCRIAREV